jgi:polyferredoxin
MSACPPPSTAALPLPARLGLALRRYRGPIIALQWLIVVAYAVLVVVPAFLPLPPESAHIWDNLRLFAQFCFWGLWWPGVMIATVTLGRVWCGIFCPEGFISERVSAYGRGRALPRWLKWSGWPFVAFVCTTVYGQLVTVVIGLLYGREKRIWCRYLCPASGVFAVLAKIAPLHYQVDRQAWDRYQGEFAPVNCAPLVDIRRMTSAGECHSCGRCAGQRDAVQLAWRSPFSEVLDPHNEAKTADALTLLFGVLGVATAAFQWTLSPWLLQIKLFMAEWLVEHEYFALLADDAPWWLLTHYPEANDVFTWLDGSLILGYLLIGGGLLGTLLLLGPLLAARVIQAPTHTWQRFVLALAPMAAASVILGLSMLTVTHLKAEGFWLGWLPYFRGILLAAGGLGAAALALTLISRATCPAGRKLLAGAAMIWPVTLMCGVWYLVFFVW